MALVPLALIVNVAVTALISFLILSGKGRMEDVYGPKSPARGILVSVYLSICIVSVFALFAVGELRTEIAFVLFPLQIIYKTLTAVFVGLKHPVVVSNLLINVLLAAAWVSLL